MLRKFVSLILFFCICIGCFYLLLNLYYGGNLVFLGTHFPRVKVAPAAISLLGLLILFCLLQNFREKAAFLLLALSLIVYLANGKDFASGDTLPARYLPMSIFRDGDFYLDEIAHLHSSSILRIDSHYVSSYPVGAPILALPFYLPSALGPVRIRSVIIFELEKLSAATLVAISVALMYLALRYLTTPRMSLLISVVYAFGTSSLSTSSQALWQHGPGQLAITAGLYCRLRGGKEPRWISLAGFPLALAVVCRPTNLLVSLPLAVYVCVHHRRQVPGFALSGLPWLLFQVWYNTYYFQDPFHTQFPLLEVWTTPFWQGLSGILLSPARGLFIYSPVFVLSFIGMVCAFRKGSHPLFGYLCVCVLLFVFFYSKWVVWWGGYCYGPRLLADLSPVLAFFLVPMKNLVGARAVWKALFVLLTAWSIAAHGIGTFLRDQGWNAEMRVGEIPGNFWLWNDNQLVNPVKRLYQRAKINLGGYPTSVTAPTLLSASYSFAVPKNLVVSAGDPLEFSLKVVNDGQAVWLAWPKRAKGTVMLHWRWLKEQQALRNFWGLAYLRFDVMPQESQEFRVSIDSPGMQGRFLLEVGLTTEKGWLPAYKNAPIRFQVEIDAAKNLQASLISAPNR